MQADNSFEVVLSKKIPYLSAFLFSIIVICLIALVLFSLTFSPTKYQSDEMKVAYYILVIPDWLKTVSAIAFIGLIITAPVYFSARLHNVALLTITDKEICIKSKQINIEISTSSVAKIYFNDLKNLLRQPKNKLQIVIQQKNKTTTSFLLKNYDDSETALAALSKITNAEFAFYDDKMLTTFDED